MTSDALGAIASLGDWRHHYPHDELPKVLLAAYDLVTRIDSDPARTAAARLRWMLVVEYENTPKPSSSSGDRTVSTTPAPKRPIQRGTSRTDQRFRNGRSAGARSV
jgi:hypothetical protein